MALRAGHHEESRGLDRTEAVLTLETLDGGDPMAAFGKMMADPTMGEFSAWAADLHGFDPKSPPPAVPRLVYDSET